MQKVLIISYFFPPCNLPASNRANGWIKYLNEFGYYPIVITRSWDLEITQSKDVLKKSGNKIIIEKQKNYEIHYLPYIPTLRDRLLQKQGFLHKKTSKILTFIELIVQNFSTKILGHHNFLPYAKCLILEQKIQKMIITANPFNLFHIGYQLNKKTGIKWIADYRDDWTTSELTEIYKSLPLKIIKKIEKHSEKKWVQSASLLTSVSEHYKTKISNFTGIRGEVITNGFYHLEENSENLLDNNIFQITYNGTLYASQKIEIFIAAILQFIKENKKPKIKINFIGLAFSEEQYQRVLCLIKGYESYFRITNRIPKKEILEIQKKSHVLLMVAHSNLKGIPSSKIYEYISLQKPILLAPSDNDIIETTIITANLGFIANNKNEVKNHLKKMYNQFVNKEPILKEINQQNLHQFSRKSSTKKLAQLLNSI